MDLWTVHCYFVAITAYFDKQKHSTQLKFIQKPGSVGHKGSIDFIMCQ